MFDTLIRPLIDPPLNAAGRCAFKLGVSANAMTLIGFGFALAAAGAIIAGEMTAALLLIVSNRLADGLDGAIARASEKSDLGGYYDIVFDFIFYGAIPFAFALHDPSGNALAAAALLLSFYANGATFLTFAIIAEKRGLSTQAQGKKSLYYLGGLAEGAETIAVFLAMCLIPGAFPIIAWGFAGVCVVSAGSRIILVSRLLRAEPPA